MANQIELFVTIKRARQILKIHPPQLDRKSQFTVKNLLILMSQLVLSVSMALFLMFETTSMAQSGLAFSIFAMIVTNIMFYLMNIIEMTNISKLIANLEDFIEMSKLNLSFQ